MDSQPLQDRPEQETSSQDTPRPLRRRRFRRGLIMGVVILVVLFGGLFYLNHLGKQILAILKPSTCCVLPPER